MSDSHGDVPRGTLERPYVTARSAAVIIGVPQNVVEADVRRVWPLECLIGGEFAGTVYVSAWELEGERLAAHRARLSDGDSGVEVSP